MQTKAIPTMYRGRLYRSRLEARYAVFFDALNWPAEYEPIDLAGTRRGYIPDFVLAFVRDRGGTTCPANMLVEVKPYLLPFDGEALATCHRINIAWQGDALLLGASHVVTEDEHTNPEIHLDESGMFPITTPSSALMSSGTIEIGRICHVRRKPFPCAAAWCAAYLAHDGAVWYPSTDADAYTHLDATHYMHARWSWANAGNASQWQPRGRIVDP